MTIFVGVFAFMLGASFGVLAMGLCIAAGLDKRDDEAGVDGREVTENK